MHKLYFLIFFILNPIILFSQEGFQFNSNKKKITVPFQLINNLIVMPIEINGVKLNFLLDTGVEKTVLFSLEESDSVQFKNVEKIKIRGLGEGKSIDAFHSKQNTVTILDLIDTNHGVYIILDQEVNFSSQLGIPVHGIIGHNFLKNYFIEVNYQKKKLSIYKRSIDFCLKKLKRYDEIPISLELEKPYILSYSTINKKKIKTKILIDTGGSDALWLFENEENIKSPAVFFKDFLGRGLSGDIFGKRSRIDKFEMGNQEINFPTVSFPDTISLKNINMVESRNGSVGSAILKRFTILFDYPNSKMYVKKNGYFEDPFNYNMSGLEIQHNGLKWIQEVQELKTKFVKEETSIFENPEKTIKYNFELKPIYEITNVRPESPAEKVGIIKGDKIIKINNKQSFKYTLQEINQIMQSDDGRTITLEVERNKKTLTFKFQLQKIL
ncbi:PDZ domain-containing protein [Flavobacterium sp.]|uniref:PDZ domain-containing protein n=1 Tax=Flavobacterium sp. TaxID=239 RepID=UPI00286EAA1E|nr:PDZ domain-containing protein [Flavobacterium sp.]